jgi:multidrug efflux system membrane fusion protein
MLPLRQIFRHSLCSVPAGLAVLGLVFSLAGCGRKTQAQGGGGKKPLVPVVVGDVIRKDMPVTVRAIGRVTSPATVAVKPQVTGTISEVHFTDGQPVKKGDPLFTIDKRPFEVALEQAKAAQAEAQTKADNAREQAQRYATLGKTGTVSREQAADFEVAAKAAGAQVIVTAAAVKAAELQLEYCDVRAPIDGRAGKALITAGNVVTANQTDLVVVNQIAPVEVTFSVAEQQLPAVQRGVAAGRPRVIARTSGIERQTAEGELVFVDNNVKATSGTIELKAAFKNDPQVLWPGQFVSLRVEVGIDHQAVVAPAASVQDGQDSKFVFVITPGKTAELHKVVVDRTVNDEAVIRSGLQGGEQIVIDGQSRLTVGSPVEIIPPSKAPMPPATPAPAASTGPAAAPTPPPPAGATPKPAVVDPT